MKLRKKWRLQKMAARVLETLPDRALGLACATLNLLPMPSGLNNRVHGLQKLLRINFVLSA